MHPQAKSGRSSYLHWTVAEGTLKDAVILPKAKHFISMPNFASHWLLGVHVVIVTNLCSYVGVAIV